MDADVLIHLVIQILTHHGPLPIGEIGKQLQTKTGNTGNYMSTHFSRALSIPERTFLRLYYRSSSFYQEDVFGTEEVYFFVSAAVLL